MKNIKSLCIRFNLLKTKINLHGIFSMTLIKRNGNLTAMPLFLR